MLSCSPDGRITIFPRYAVMDCSSNRPMNARLLHDAGVRVTALRAALHAPAGRLRPLIPSSALQRLAVVPSRTRSVRQRGCHLYFARRVTFLTCADMA